MPRTKEKERPLYASKVRAYLSRHLAGDVDAQDLSQEGIARGAGVSRTQLSEAASCEIIDALVKDIDRVRRGEPMLSEGSEVERAAAAAAASSRIVGCPAHVAAQTLQAREVPGLDRLSDAAINTRIQALKRQAVKATESWTARHSIGGGTDDAGLAAEDLHQLARTLRRIADDLEPVLQVRARRLAGTPITRPWEATLDGGSDQGALGL